MTDATDPVPPFVDYPETAVAAAPGGLLAGTTFAVKDIFDVAGYPTGCGNPEKRAASGIKDAHAAAVARLLAAGSRFVGKTHTAELAFSLDGRNDHYGTPENPAALGRVPGGSSSGSAAAVAAGLADIALGSDTGGSIRAPASFCGIVGLRPTFGRVDRSGMAPLSPSLDTAGWFTRDVALYERVASVLLGDDERGGDLRRMVVADDAWALLAPDGEDAALRPWAARVADMADRVEAVTLAPEGLPAWQEIFRTVQAYEAWRAHGAWIEAAKPRLMPAVRSRFEAGRRVTAAAYADAAERRDGVRARVAGLLGDDGVIVLPTVPTIAPEVGAEEAVFDAFRARALSMLCVAGLAGLPQISLPVARFAGCPLGLSMIGPAGRDRALIALARRVMG